MPSSSPCRMIGYWDSPQLPADISRILDTWREHGPDDITIYDRDSAVAFIEEHYGPRERAAFLSCAIPAMQSDVFRALEILHAGGFYLDLGIELLAPPTPFLYPGENLVLYRRWHGRIVNNMFSCASRHPILAEITETILDNVTRRVSDNIWLVSGPSVWNTVTHSGGRPGTEAHEHAELAGNICVFHQELDHKKDGNHWSHQQKDRSIYND